LTCCFDISPILWIRPASTRTGVGAAGKAEQIDRVAISVIVDDEFVGIEHVVVEPVSRWRARRSGGVLHQLLPRIRPRQRADTGIVEHHLARRGLLGLAQRPVQLEHIEMFSLISLPVPSQQMTMFFMDAVPQLQAAD